ncbi:MAG: hypothetical protein AABW88_05380 [Nanoarchaeota archaeon]
MIAKKYSDFMKGLNKIKIEWCLIKDYDYLLRTGYDNEIDLIAHGKDRDKIRKLGRSLGWNESALNSANTHLIFWKFEGLKPFRIDVHLDKALATAVPWLKAKDILRDKLKKGELWIASPKYELALLIMGSLRGRKPKPWRIKRAKELICYLNEAKHLLVTHLTNTQVEKYSEYLIKGKIMSLSRLKRLGLVGIVRNMILLPQLSICRIFKPAKVVFVSNKLEKQLFNLLVNAKLNVKKANNPILRWFSDVIIKINNKNNETDIKKVISNLNGENDVY